MENGKLEGKNWALILGASSGIGAATAIELAKSGFNILGVFLGRKESKPSLAQVGNAINAAQKIGTFFKCNAADEKRRTEVLDILVEEVVRLDKNSTIKVLVHSLAFGNLKPFMGADINNQARPINVEMTLDVMANSLVYWTQGLLNRKLMRSGGRIFAITSSGSSRVLKNYGAVGAAKAALEAHVRQLAVELAPDITVNAIRAGITDTPALRKIPGHEELRRTALKRNPSHRLTTPEDVAKAITLLTDDRAAWITGNVIGVDGGEDIVA